MLPLQPAAMAFAYRLLLLIGLVMPVAMSADPPPSCCCARPMTVRVTHVAATSDRSAPPLSVTVTTTDFVFTQQSITITIGDTVTWSNNSGITHTSCTGDTAVWDSGDILTGTSFSRTFNTAGTFPYHCHYHQGLGMVGTVIVNPPATTITWPAPVAVAYGTALSATQLDATTGIPGTFVYTPASGTILHAGTNQTLSVTFTPTDPLHFSSATTTVTLDVTTAPLTITATDATRPYGSANPSFAFTVSGLQSTDTISQVSETTSATIASPVSTYAITAGSASFSSGQSSDYAISYVTGTLHVLAVTLTVAGSLQGMIQGSAVPALTYSITGFVNGDTQNSATLGSPALSNPVTSSSLVGTYATTVTIGTLSAVNYVFTLTDGSVSVAANVLVITADPQTSVYGSTLPALTYHISGFVNGDTAATALNGTALVTTTALSSSAAGAYPIILTQGSLAALTPGIYAFTFIDGSLTINPAPLTITASSLAMTVGDTVPTLSAVFTGLVNGDTQASLATPPTLTPNATSGSAPGAYPIIVSGATDSNYSITFVPGTLTVNAVVNATSTTGAGVTGSSLLRPRPPAVVPAASAERRQPSWSYLSPAAVIGHDAPSDELGCQSGSASVESRGSLPSTYTHQKGVEGHEVRTASGIAVWIPKG